MPTALSCDVNGFSLEPPPIPDSPDWEWNSGPVACEARALLAQLSQTVLLSLGYELIAMTSLFPGETALNVPTSCLLQSGCSLFGMLGSGGIFWE